jgi:hypothetical protein
MRQKEGADPGSADIMCRPALYPMMGLTHPRKRSRVVEPRGDGLTPVASLRLNQMRLFSL